MICDTWKTKTIGLKVAALFVIELKQKYDDLQIKIR